MGDPANLSLRPGETGSIPLRLRAASPLHGIDGELEYDTTNITGVSVAAAQGAATFTVVSHEPTPGHLRFVVYDPEGLDEFDLSQPILQFTFTASSSVRKSVSSEAKFTISDAARIQSANPADVLSLGVGGFGRKPAPEYVDFGSFLINIGWSAAQGWGRYE